MYAHGLTLTVLLLGSVSAFGTPAVAADLPQSGTIKLHSSDKANLQIVQLGEKHVMASFSGGGVSYNDAGSGPLHVGAWVCVGSVNGVNGSYNEGGSCAFGDAGGADTIFTTFSGKATDEDDQGTHIITGGIGRYAGIRGTGKYDCKPVNAALSIYACTQEFDYQLSTASATK